MNKTVLVVLLVLVAAGGAAYYFLVMRKPAQLPRPVYGPEHPLYSPPSSQTPGYSAMLAGAGEKVAQQAVNAGAKALGDMLSGWMSGGSSGGAYSGAD